MALLAKHHKRQKQVLAINALPFFDVTGLYLRYKSILNANDLPCTLTQTQSTCMCACACTRTTARDTNGQCQKSLGSVLKAFRFQSLFSSQAKLCMCPRVGFTQLSTLSRRLGSHSKCSTACLPLLSGGRRTLKNNDTRHNKRSLNVSSSSNNMSSSSKVMALELLEKKVCVEYQD